MGIIRVMSHNVWKCDNNQPAWKEKGMDCSAVVRAKGMVRVYTETHPDIIGFQEMSSVMSEHIIQGLLEQGYRYAMLWGKDTPILYRQERLELLDSDFLMYPIEVPGWDGEFNNSGTKSWCCAVFKDKTDGKKIIFMTTHLWWMSGNPAEKNYRAGSDDARVYQLNMAMKRLEEFHNAYNCPVILVGDFNASYKSPVMQNALSKGYAHSHDIATEFADQDWGYHYCFGDGYKPYVRSPFENGIDHIMVNFAPEGFVRRFERYTPEYYLPLSDHSPVFADVDLY